MGGVVLLNTQPGGTYFNAAGRAVEFDTVPIGAVDRMSIIKTGLPDHDAEGIGGSVELTPRTAIGANRLFADVTLGGGVETFAGKGLYRDEVVVGGPIGGQDSKVSFVLSQFLYNDHRSFHDMEAGYVDAAGTPDKAFSALELRKYDYYRQRFGYSGEMDFVPSEGQRYYLRASMAGYNEHAYRNRMVINFDGNPTASGNTLTDTGSAQRPCATMTKPIATSWCNWVATTTWVMHIWNIGAPIRVPAMTSTTTTIRPTTTPTATPSLTTTSPIPICPATASHRAPG
jgi:hypothetical protein